MALDKFHYVYGLDTSCLYTNEEMRISKELSKLRKTKEKLKERIKFHTEKNNKNSQAYVLFYNNINHDINIKIKTAKENLINVMSSHVGARNIRIQSLNEHRKVSIFSSELTRCFDLIEDDINEQIMIIKVYYFPICEQIIRDGFYYKGEKYVYFSSSAGQIRTKKMVCVNEHLLRRHWNTLTCGLTLDKINEKGGMNINKYLAYLALCNSATDVWENFDVDKVIVVDDFETMVNAEVDYIDDVTYEITRKKMNVPIPNMDGCGIVELDYLPKNAMLRMPFVKGLISPFPFRKFIKTHACSPIITDIYGVDHNIIDEDIKVILTKSQMKMWKFWDNFKIYQNDFKRYRCHACLCNVEEDEFNNATINYQMIQSLVDCTNAELIKMTQKSADDIRNISKDKNTMLKAFGVTKGNYHKNGFQKCLELYPELLGEPYSRATLRDIKNSLEKDMWSAKFEVNGKYTFIIPDLYAFCEWLFLKQEVPKGLLDDGEVSCNLYKRNQEVCCLRSPHLYQEWAVRNNVDNDNVKEWFNTNAVYISTHDIISKILMCDFDGDKSLVIQDKLITEIAKRNMKGIVPLYYDMKKAAAKEINSESLYSGLSNAFVGSNIGIYSNDISKIKNSENFINKEKYDEALKCVKWLCMENNYKIDYAKTLYMPIRPHEVDEIIKSYTKAKLPAYFKYAKDKKDSQIETNNNSTVNRIRKFRKKQNINIKFNVDGLGKFDYKVLMDNPNIEINIDISNKFSELTKYIKFRFNADDDGDNYNAILSDVRKEMLKVCNDEKYIVDVLVKRLFDETKTDKKRAFWSIYGSIVYENIKKNLNEKFIMCSECGRRFYQYNANQRRCSVCSVGRNNHISKSVKIIVCCDCGKEFTVVGSNKRTSRCDNCRQIYRFNQAKEIMDKKRGKLV